MGEGDPRAGHGEGDAGSVNVPVVCAGAAINPGDVIVGDVDGVVVVPQATAAEVAKAGAERVAKEEKSRARLQERGARPRLLRASRQAGRTWRSVRRRRAENSDHPPISSRMAELFDIFFTQA